MKPGTRASVFHRTPNKNFVWNHTNDARKRKNSETWIHKIRTDKPVRYFLAGIYIPVTTIFLNFLHSPNSTLFTNRTMTRIWIPPSRLVRFRFSRNLFTGIDSYWDNFSQLFSMQTSVIPIWFSNPFSLFMLWCFRVALELIKFYHETI